MAMPSEVPKNDEAARAHIEQLAAGARRVETSTSDGGMVWHCWGEGAPLVLLHGGSGSWTHWVRTIPRFMDSRAVLVADLPGLGDSPDPPAVCTADSLTSIVADGIGQLIPEGSAADVVGFSFGGIVAGHLAADFPSLVRRLVMVGVPPFGLTTEGPTNEVRAVDPALDLDEASDQHRRNLGLLMIADPGRIDPLALRLHHDNLLRSRLGSRKIARSGTLEGTLRRASCPIHGIWGEKDVTASPDLAAIRDFFLGDDGLGHLTQSFDVLPGVGHWAPYEAPDAVNQLLAQYIESS